MTLGERLKQLRTLRGWSQRELARQSGVQQSLLSDLETGKQSDTSGAALASLARSLGTTVDYLAGMYDTDPHRSPGKAPR